MAKVREFEPRAALESAPTLGGKAADLELGLTETLSGDSGPHAAGQDAAVRISVNADSGAVVPARIGRYLVLRQLGQGAMGTVYSAYDPDLDRRVAVKVVRGRGDDGTGGQARVLREAQAMARIAHPNVVSVFEVGEAAESPHKPVYIAMELVSGGSLRDWQSQRGAEATVDEVVQLYLQAAAGLEAAHRCGLIHRDFKPDNALVGDDGRVRVADFGLARTCESPPTSEHAHAPASPSESGERLTLAGAILGTPGYMAPEQVMGQEADARSDQFAFSAALFEALYHQLPFPSDSFEEFAAHVCAGQLQPPPRRKDGREIPLPIEQALRRGLSRDPAERFPSMQVLSAALSLGLHPDSEMGSSVRRKKFARVATALFFLVLVVAYVTNVEQTFEAKDLRLAAAVSWGLIVASLGSVLLMPKRTLHQPSYRKFWAFAFGCLFYSAIGRSMALLLEMSPRHYLLAETLGLTALFGLEIRGAGIRFVWPAALCGLDLVLQLLFPKQVLLTETLLLNAAAVLSVYLHPGTHGLGAAMVGRPRAVEKPSSPPPSGPDPT